MTDSPAFVIRDLLRSEPRGALGTLDALGAPYVSLVMLAVDHDASPLLLLSDLADHTRNLKADPRVSLLIDGTRDMATPLAGARATLMGEIAPSADAHRLARFVARHPDAAQYAGFTDFHLYRVAILRAHLVAGFGRIHWVDGAAVLWPCPADLPLASAEAEIVAHMNADHGDAVELYATRLLDQPPGAWQLTGIDPEGADLRLGKRIARLRFNEPITDATAARAELVRLVKRARRAGDAATT